MKIVCDAHVCSLPSPDLFKGVRTSLSGVAIAIARIIEQLGQGISDHTDVINGEYPEEVDVSSGKRNDDSENGDGNLRCSASEHSRSAPMAKKNNGDGWTHRRTSAKPRPMKILPFSPEQLSLHETGLFSDEKEASAKVTSPKILELVHLAFD